MAFKLFSNRFPTASNQMSTKEFYAITPNLIINVVLVDQAFWSLINHSSSNTVNWIYEVRPFRIIVRPGESGASDLKPLLRVSTKLGITVLPSFLSSSSMMYWFFWLWLIGSEDELIDNWRLSLFCSRIFMVSDVYAPSFLDAPIVSWARLGFYFEPNQA